MVMEDNEFVDIINVESTEPELNEPPEKKQKLDLTSDYGDKFLKPNFKGKSRQKKSNLKKLIRSTPRPVVPCFTILESLHELASKHGCHFDVVQRKKKNHLQPYAETLWFYNKHQNGRYNAKKPKLSGCKHLLVKAHQINAYKIQVSKKSLNFFEVEYIANFRVMEGKRYYLVKWVGWPMEANTWEPVTNLSCPGLIQDFHQDYMNQVHDFLKEKNLTWHKLLKSKTQNKHILQRLFDIIPNNFHFHAQYATKKQNLLSHLQTWQKKMNSNKRLPIIAIENEVDLEPLPSNFTYVVNNIPGNGVTLPTDPILGCECEGGCGKHIEKGGCCPGFHRGRSAYSNGLIRLKPGRPIFECNSRCKCGPNCPNRVVQKGPQSAISLFRTSNGKGWGVKALQIIPKGSFVMEYVGEIITNDEAEKRGKEYDSNGSTYLFDLDFCDSENPLTVDATNYGNISHFVNHSCSPNLQVYNVFIDNLDPSLPRIALFARRNIQINEELTFDYQMTGNMTDGQEDVVSNITETPPGSDDAASDISYASSCSSIVKRTPCLCGSTNCRLWLI